MKLSRVKILATVLVLATTAVLLVACGPHQIIDRGETCESCHENPDFDKDSLTFDVDYPNASIEVGSEVDVHTSADRIVVCRPTFIAEDGSKFVPEHYREAKVEDGVAHIQLEEGCWALCIDHGDSAEGKIVLSSGANDGAAEIEL